MANIAYELAIRLGTVVHLLSRAKRHAEDPAEREMASERLRPLEELDLPQGRSIYWIHAVSMGEVGVAAVLVRELKKQSPDALAVVSTATVTGFEAAKTKIAEADAVVAARFDIRDLVATMFDSIRPTAIVLVEGDLWRNMLAIARRRGVPVFVANAKMSEKSLAFYQRFPVYSRSIFSRIAHVYAQTALYRQRFLEVGLAEDRCEVSGNVKLDVVAPTPIDEELADIKQRAGCTDASPIVTFGSIHPGEELPAIRAMRRVWQSHPTAHALLVPRHIEKTSQFVESIRNEFGLDARVYSALTPPPRSPQAPNNEGAGESRITIVDQMGMLMKLYALADIGVVGGTFISGIGGHNLTEPAFYGKSVIYGPYVNKQPGLHDLVTSYDAGRQVTDETFPDVLLDLVEHPETAHRLGENGRKMVADSRGVAERIVRDILARAATSTQP
jgi:3-deoxy-D-manno-octulosonic-acid transferase